MQSSSGEAFKVTYRRTDEEAAELLAARRAAGARPGCPEVLVTDLDLVSFGDWIDHIQDEVCQAVLCHQLQLDRAGTDELLALGAGRVLDLIESGLSRDELLAHLGSSAPAATLSQESLAADFPLIAPLATDAGMRFSEFLNVLDAADNRASATGESDGMTLAAEIYLCRITLRDSSANGS